MPAYMMDDPCPNCGQRFTVVSAQRLLAGKKKAHVVVRCGCYATLVRLRKADREAFVRLHRH
jgi:hypothetical protein